MGYSSFTTGQAIICLPGPAQNGEGNVDAFTAGRAEGRTGRAEGTNDVDSSFVGDVTHTLVTLESLTLGNGSRVITLVGGFRKSNTGDPSTSSSSFRAELKHRRDEIGTEAGRPALF